MKGIVEKRGKGLAIRIPTEIAKLVKLKEGSQVELDTRDGVLTLIPPGKVLRRRRSKYRIAELLRGWKGPHPYRGMFKDPPVGREMI